MPFYLSSPVPHSVDASGPIWTRAITCDNEQAFPIMRSCIKSFPVQEDAEASLTKTEQICSDLISSKDGCYLESEKHWLVVFTHDYPHLSVYVLTSANLASFENP